MDFQHNTGNGRRPPWGRRLYVAETPAARLTEVYLCLMLLVFPLFTGFSGYLDLTRAKFLFFAIVTGLWLAALAALRLRALWRARKAPKRPDALALAILLFLLACTLSALCSPWFPRPLLGTGRYDGLLTLWLYGGIFWGVSATARPRPAHLCMLALSTLLCCAVALLQLLDKNALWLFPYGYSYYDSGIAYTGAFLSTIGNVDLLSAFFCLGVPGFCAAFLCGEGRRRWLYALAAAAGTGVLAASGVAGGAVALAVCALLTVPLLLRTRERLWRALALCALLLAALLPALSLDLRLRDGGLYADFHPRRALTLAAACVLTLLLRFFLKKQGLPRWSGGGFLRFFLLAEVAAALLFLTALWFWPGQTGTLAELSSLLHGQLSDSFGSQRVEIWRRTLALVPERPLLGGGPDTLALRLDLHYARQVPETGRTLAVYVDNAHNEYLGFLVNTGFFGLGGYLLCLGLSLRRLFLRRAEPAALCLGCGLLCYWIQSFFGLGLCVVNPLLWLLWGLALPRKKEERNDDGRHF